MKAISIEKKTTEEITQQLTVVISGKEIQWILNYAIFESFTTIMKKKVEDHSEMENSA